MSQVFVGSRLFGVRAVFVVCAASMGACATTSALTPQALREVCAENMAADARCEDVVVWSKEGYEARAEVRAAEDAREAVAFRDRLTRMREAHEARVAERLEGRPGSSVASKLGSAPPDGALAAASGSLGSSADDVGRQLEQLAQRADLETGSSVRAVVAAPAAPAAAKVPPPGRLPAPGGFGPTPEAWLRASLCLLVEDQAILEQRLTEQRAAGDRGAAGAAALLVVDVQGLARRVRAELVHRKLAKQGPLCSSSALFGARSSLRRELGTAPSGMEAVDRYARGLDRISKTLEVRAGLPRRQ